VIALLLAAAASAAPPAPAARPTVPSTPARGVTGPQLAAAVTAVPVLTFEADGARWEVACRGPQSDLRCRVTSPSRTEGRVVSGTASTLVVQVGGQELTVDTKGTAMSFQHAGACICSDCRSDCASAH
jgi:hypothetical protein